MLGTAWKTVRRSKRSGNLLAALPDGKLLNSLRAARGKGRNDYPVTVLWGVVVLRVALRHVTTEAVLAELRRNEGLRRLIGIESEAGVPKPWNISRFEDVLGQEPHRTLLKEIFDVLIQRLGVVVADLGATPPVMPRACRHGASRKKAAQEEIDEGLPQASGGRKEYKDDEGKVTKVVEVVRLQAPSPRGREARGGALLRDHRHQGR